MKRVVSISLGSSKRDHRAEIQVEGETFIVERVGTDGDLLKAHQKFLELDGKVDVLCMGGTDLYFYLGKHRYPVRDAWNMVRGVRNTPIADGSKLKVALEYQTVKKITKQEILRPGMKVLMISAVDRYGMGQGFDESGADVLYGDFLFGLGLNIPLRRLSSVRRLARILLPVICRLPFSWLYPTGKKQEQNTPKYQSIWRWADLIAGDFHYIARYMPSDMAGKVVLTNTVTASDIDWLKQRGIRTLITTTPEMQGRSFGTNVIEGILVCLLKKDADQITAEESIRLLARLGFEPRIVSLI
jgi:hypothetical protein